MKKLFSSFWFLLTVFLSAIFVVLFYPAVKDNVGSGEAVLLSIVGVIIIWIVFFVRARIFSRK